MCQNTPQLCWKDEWPTLSPGRQPGRASSPAAAAGYFTAGEILLIRPKKPPPINGGATTFYCLSHSYFDDSCLFTLLSICADDFCCLSLRVIL